MKRKAVSGIMLALLALSMITMAFEIQQVEASGTIYIRADGSINPPTANITSVDNVTYYFTGNNYDPIVVERSNIVIDGNGQVLQGSRTGYGFYLLGINNVTVKDTSIECFDFGIGIYGSSNNRLNGNNITNLDGGGDGHGIDLSDSLNNSITGNNIANNNGGGISFWNSSYNTISGNNITANDSDGIYLATSSNNSILGNSITNNGRAIVLYYGSSNSITKNNITNNGLGIYFYYGSSGNSVSGNNIADNWAGIYFISGGNSIYGNVFVRDGVCANGYYGNVVVDNLINGKPLVYLEDASNLVVEDAGQVILTNCNNITIRNLNLSYTIVAIQLWQTSNSTIMNNNITADIWEAMTLCYSNNNRFSGNTITDNPSAYGVYLVDSFSNKFYHNNFYCYARNVFSSDSTNF